MAITYKLLKDTYKGTTTGVSIKREDESIASIPFDPANTDYQEYLKWVEEGNTADPAD